MEDKIQKINNVLLEIETLRNRNKDSLEFIRWKEKTTKIIEKIIGQESEYYIKFSQIQYFNVFNLLGKDLGDSEEKYQDGLNKATVLLETLREEVELLSKVKGEKNVNANKNIKLFISHATKDKEYTDALVELLHNIGIPKNDTIFCSSKEGYGIPLNRDIYTYLKEKLDEDVIVLIVLSNNYYDSVACLNEMGAVWMGGKSHYVMLLPSFEFSEMEGAIDPRKISLKINNKDRLTEFKDEIVKIFNLNNIKASIWEDDRDKFIKQINELAERDEKKNLLYRVEVEKVRKENDKKIKIALRFINEGNNPREFKEATIELSDLMENKYTIKIEAEQLKHRIVYMKENRREEFEFELVNTKYNPNKHSMALVESSFDII